MQETGGDFRVIRKERLMEYSINEHSSIRVAAEKIIYFDPFHIEEESHDADVIFVTHSHYDHLDPESIEKISNDDTLYVLPLSCAEEAEEAGIPEAKIKFMMPDDLIYVKGLEVKAVLAYNMGKKFHPMNNRWLGYVVFIGGKHIYVMGDTDANPYTRNVECDICFVPAGGKYTMDHEDAAFFINEIRPQLAVPTHYGTVVGGKDAGEKFKALIDEGIEVDIVL